MIRKKELLCRIENLEKEQKNLEIELFMTKYPKGKIGIEEKKWGFFGGLLIQNTYSYVDKEIKTAYLYTKDANIKNVSIFKDFPNTFLKVDSICSEYFILNKSTRILDQISEDLLSKDIIWENIYTIKQ